MVSSVRCLITQGRKLSQSILTKRNEERIGKNKEAYFVFVTMGQKNKIEKIWLCGSVGKIKGIGKQGEVKMHEINVHTIANFQRYVQSYGLPKLSIRGLGKIYERALVALPTYLHTSSNTDFLLSCGP